MCGRLNILSDPLSRLLMDLVGLAYTGRDNFNLAPTETVQVVRTGPDGDYQLLPMRWWLTPFWAKERSTRYSMFNARAETAATSAAFKMPYRKQRCVVPVSGFYEWSRGNNRRLPYLIKAGREGGLFIAGLWDRWRDIDSGEELLSFTILTTAASKGLEFIHKRQPVMLSANEVRCWLDMQIPTVDLAHLLNPRIPVALDAVPVSTYVNNARHKDSRCMEPMGASISIQSDKGK